jgi:hypothetical protein
MNSLTRRAALASVTLTLLGCPAPTPSTDASFDSGDGGVCLANGATVTLGTGATGALATFRPLEDGDDVVLVPGPQGGQHIWIGLRARGIDPTQPRVELRVYRERDNTLIGGLRVRLRMINAGEAGLWGLPGQTLIVDDDQYCTVLPGDVRVTLDFSDGVGHCTHIERRVHITGVDPLALDIDRAARLRCCTQFLRRCYPDGGPPGADATAPDGG